MPLFFRSRSNKNAGKREVEDSDTQLKPKPYKHIPIHAARDARFQVPPSAREADRLAIIDHHKCRNQMLQQTSPILKAQNLPALTIDTFGERKKPSAGQRDALYVGKNKPPHTSRRPTSSLTELSHLSAQQKIRALRRAAHVEPTAEVTYHLGLLPSPLTHNTAVDPNIEKIPLPIRTHPPLSARRTRSQPHQIEEHSFDSDSSVSSTGQPGIPTARKSSGTSYCDQTLMRNASSTSSQEPLDPPPFRTRARDSISHKLNQDPRFHNPNSSPGRGHRLRAAHHDTTGIEQAMSTPESFQPRRAPPAIVRTDSGYPAMPMAGFDHWSTAERPYSPARLRPWLTNNKHNAFKFMSTINAV